MAEKHDLSPSDGPLLKIARTESTERPRIVKVDGRWLLPPIGNRQTAEAKRVLRNEGMVGFLEQYLPDSPRGVDILYVTTLLGFFPSSLTEDIDDEKNLMKAVKVLQKAMNKVISTRSRIQDLNTVEKAIDAIEKAQKIVVLTGAGISTSLGIPDFRSDKGIYSLVEDLGLDDPQQVFDLDTFRLEPAIFYKVAHMVLPPENKWTPTHAFIKALSDKGKLLRNYTQNIDNIEASVGIPSDQFIQCHGSFATATCRTCGRQVEGSKIFPIILTEQLPVCPKCFFKRKQKLKDSDSTGDYGIMKPDITFFGEDLPGNFYDNLGKDVEDCDLLICIGTSLKVAPVNNIVNRIRPEVPQLLINRDDISFAEFDVTLVGYCDEVVSYLSKKLGWDLNHEDYEKISQSNFELRIEDADEGMYSLKVVSESI